MMMIIILMRMVMMMKSMVIPAILEPTAACVVNSPTLVLQATPGQKGSRLDFLFSFVLFVFVLVFIFEIVMRL